MEQIESDGISNITKPEIDNSTSTQHGIDKIDSLWFFLGAKTGQGTSFIQTVLGLGSVVAIFETIYLFFSKIVPSDLYSHYKIYIILYIFIPLIAIAFLILFPTISDVSKSGIGIKNAIIEFYKKKRKEKFHNLFFSSNNSNSTWKRIFEFLESAIPHIIVFYILITLLCTILYGISEGLHLFCENNFCPGTGQYKIWLGYICIFLLVITTIYLFTKFYKLEIKTRLFFISLNVFALLPISLFVKTNLLKSKEKSIQVDDITSSHTLTDLKNNILNLERARLEIDTLKSTFRNISYLCRNEQYIKKIKLGIIQDTLTEREKSRLLVDINNDVFATALKSWKEEFISKVRPTQADIDSIAKNSNLNKQDRLKSLNKILECAKLDSLPYFDNEKRKKIVKDVDAIIKTDSMQFLDLASFKLTLGYKDFEIQPLDKFNSKIVFYKPNERVNSLLVNDVSALKNYYTFILDSIKTDYFKLDSTILKTNVVARIYAIELLSNHFADLEVITTNINFNLEDRLRHLYSQLFKTFSGQFIFIGSTLIMLLIFTAQYYVHRCLWMEKSDPIVLLAWLKISGLIIALTIVLFLLQYQDNSPDSIDIGNPDGKFRIVSSNQLNSAQNSTSIIKMSPQEDERSRTVRLDEGSISKIIRGVNSSE